MFAKGRAIGPLVALAVCYTRPATHSNLAGRALAFVAVSRGIGTLTSVAPRLA